MSRKTVYIKAMLIENIEVATKTIDELYAEIKEVEKLPNDCTGILIDGFVCENSNYKIDILTNHYHVIGYMESQRALSQELLDLDNMTDDKFEEYLVEQEEIQKHNELEMKRVEEKIFGKNFDNTELPIKEPIKYSMSIGIVKCKDDNCTTNGLTKGKEYDVFGDCENLGYFYKIKDDNGDIKNYLPNFFETIILKNK